MEVKSGQCILNATSPREIFSMNPDTLEMEFEKYQEAYQPKAYSNIQNFIIMQKVTMLYRTAKEVLFEREEGSFGDGEGVLEYTAKNGRSFGHKYIHRANLKVSEMFVTDKQIIFVTPGSNRKYHENYLQKTRRFQRLDSDLWKQVELMLPKVVENVETTDGDLVIVLDKPSSRVYSMREILDFYNGKMHPRYVASILNCLYSLLTYFEIIGINYNAFTVDNLFFSPGRTTEIGKEYTIDDMRFVGAYGGWFFSTWSNEKIKGLPREIYDLLSPAEKAHGYSSFKVNALAIKQVARELLGDVSGGMLENTPIAMIEWLNSDSCEKNAYEEYCAWEQIKKASFGKSGFVDMDVSI